MAIVSTLGMDSIAEFDAASRPKNAAIECILAFRYARQLALTTGTNTKVTFNTASNSFSVYRMSNGSTWDASPVTQPATHGGIYTITMNSSTELNGVIISLNPSGTTALTFRNGPGITSRFM